MTEQDEREVLDSVEALTRLQSENDELRAEVERLRADQRYLDESVRNQAIRETIHKEELNRLRVKLEAQDQVVEASRRLMTPGAKFSSHYRAIAQALGVLDGTWPKP